MKLTFHYLLLVNQSLFHRKVFQNLEPSKLTLGQPKVLDYLDEHDGCMQKDITHACHMDAATTAGILLRMEESGLLERKNMNGNRRSLFVFLTDKGKEELLIVKKVFNKLETEAFWGFTAEEKGKFMEMFKRIHDNLEQEV